MKNKWLLFLGIGICFTMVNSANAADIMDHYTHFKEKLHSAYGFDYTLQAGFLAQRMAPSGKKTILRGKYEIAANWEAFHSDKIGDGSFQFLYSDINYLTLQASTLANRFGIVTGINDNTSRREYFKKLTYTHRLAGYLKNWSVSVGQYAIGNFSKANYQSRPWNYFNNHAVQKTETEAHPTAGVGGYITYTALPELTVIAGIQDTTNFLPQNVRLKYIDDGKWTSFLYTEWQPDLTTYGKSSVTGLIYYSPVIKKYPGSFNKAYPKKATGMAMTVRQNINQWTAAFKMNTSTGNRASVSQSYGLMLIYNNPFHRNKMDQIGIGLTTNKVSNRYNTVAHRWESGAELYWNWAISDYLSITPDIQVFMNPALNNTRHTAFASTIQSKFFF